MRLLIVDDDAPSRSILRALLKQHMHAQVIEAEDGAEALDAIQRTAPDAVFLDLQMPVMDGLSVLEALREDPEYRSLPVVVMSAVGDGTAVKRAIGLGITDFLVKPLRPLSVDKRIVGLLGAIGRRPKPSRDAALAAPARAGEDGSRRILLVDADGNFRSFFAGLFEQEYEIVEAQNGVEALRALAGRPADVICIGTGLKLPTEHMLARRIRAMDHDHPVALFLCTDGVMPDAKELTDFDGVLHKTFVPDVFRKEFLEVALGDRDPRQVVMGLLSDRLRDDVVTAMRQTVGVTTRQETHLLDAAEAATTATEICASMELRGGPEVAQVDVRLAASRADVEHLAERMGGSPPTDAAGAGAAFGELLKTVAARVVSTLGAQGVALTIGVPTIAEAPAAVEPDPWRVVLAFETDGKERVLLLLSVLPPALAPEPAATPDPAATPESAATPEPTATAEPAPGA
jgi:CheY-like chemotaxis protein